MNKLEIGQRVYMNAPHLIKGVPGIVISARYCDNNKEWEYYVKWDTGAEGYFAETWLEIRN